MRWERGLLGAGVIALLAGSVSGQTRDIDGRSMSPFQPAGKATVLLFVQTDCPISNSYAPEIQRICKAYESKGVGCSLAYEDVRVEATAVRKHLKDFSYSAIPATIDSSRTLADRAKTGGDRAGLPAGVDPDIADIRPGPQPLADWQIDPEEKPEEA